MMLTSPSRYSPWLVDRGLLRRLLVGRDELLQHLVDSLRDVAVGGGGRYELLVGPRGAGKSHLLALVHQALTTDPLAGKAFVVAALQEEESIASLEALLGRILNAMPTEAGLPNPQTLFQHLQQLPLAAVAEQAVALIKARLQGRSLIIFLENLDSLFVALGRTGQQSLRRLLQTEVNWSIMAGSRTASAAFLKESEPFFHTLNRRTLEPLSSDQCREMLRRLAEHSGKADLESFLASPQGLARVKSLRTFTGGNPRAMALVFPYLTRESLDDLVESFYAFADELTPYFQEQLARLPPGQATLLEALAENWRPMTVKALAQVTFTPETSASTQLRRMQKDHLVRSIRVGRHTLYEVAEPLYRIARAMKRSDQAMPTLARFLRIWYACEDLLPLLEHLDLRELVLRALALPKDRKGQVADGSAAVAMFRAGRYRDMPDYFRRLDDSDRADELAALVRLVPGTSTIERSAFSSCSREAAPFVAGFMCILASGSEEEALRVVDEVLPTGSGPFVKWVWRGLGTESVTLEGLPSLERLPSTEAQVWLLVGTGLLGLAGRLRDSLPTGPPLVRQLLEVQRLLIQCQPALLDDAVTANSLLTMFGALLPESAAWFGSLMVAHAELGSSRPFLEALLVDEEVRAEALSAEERQILQKLKGARAKLREVFRVLAEPAAGQAGGGGGAATSPCTS